MASKPSTAQKKQPAAKSTAKPAPAAAARPRAKILTRSTLGPALGIGVIVAFLAGQENAPVAISVVVGVVVAAVVVGMIAMKRTFYGD